MERDQAYHRGRARQCKEMAESATDLGVRRLHQQLAELHMRCIDAVGGGRAL